MFYLKTYLSLINRFGLVKFSPGGGVVVGHGEEGGQQIRDLTVTGLDPRRVAVEFLARKAIKLGSVYLVLKPGMKYSSQEVCTRFGYVVLNLGV
jgi:hypothetical protein